MKSTIPAILASGAPDAPLLASRSGETLRNAVLLFAIWTLPGLLSTALVHSQSPAGQPLWRTFLSQLPPWWFWAPATPLIFRVTRAFPVVPREWARSLPAHLLVSVGLSAASLAVAVVACESSGVGACHAKPFAVSFRRLAVYHAELNFGIYAVVVAAGAALDSSRRARETELHAAKLQGMLANAQLQALKMQLHPHFLFNSLHAVGVMVRKGDQQGALRMLSGISDLLRIALDTSGRQIVPLRQEIDFLERYLEVERTRFADRLAVKFDVDATVRHALVPNLALQPVVENAIRHGVEPRVEPGTVVIAAVRDGEWLRVTVRDDGPGLSGKQHGHGIGLANVRARLEQLFPGKHKFTVENAEGGGVLVTMEIPYASELTRE